jgi:hypothetical protein
LLRQISNKMKEITSSRIRRWQKSHTILARRKMTRIRINGWVIPWAGADYNNKAEGEE